MKKICEFRGRMSKSMLLEGMYIQSVSKYFGAQVGFAVKGFSKSLTDIKFESKELDNF